MDSDCGFRIAGCVYGIYPNHICDCAKRRTNLENYVEITGKDAINYYKSNMVQGVVKPEILRDAVRRYQEVYKTYDSVYGDNIPSESIL